ncbi:hypothetical protein QR680_010493 [Steinernema hermaphroditum]|uniref:Tudor domain-containing protein n=1 Tax=Steinernema hermaphroditum TaxID=289476 RepID=A0AA39IR28_9BILA|nr:hypothetical protein QR680_010493 [Steinernema hermaphroditum]
MSEHRSFGKCFDFYMRASLAGVTPLCGRDGTQIGDLLCTRTAFKIPSYSETFLNLSKDGRLPVKNLVVEDSNVFYAVPEDSDWRLTHIENRLTRSGELFRRKFNVGISHPVLVQDENNRLHRGVVFDRLEKVRVYLVDSGRTVDVPYGEVLAIPSHHWLLDRKPLAFRFSLEGLPEDFVMTEEEARNMIEYTRGKCMTIKFQDDLRDLLLEGRFKGASNPKIADHSSGANGHQAPGRRYKYGFEMASNGLPITCFYCQENGHRAERCWKKKFDTMCK